MYPLTVSGDYEFLIGSALQKFILEFLQDRGVVHTAEILMVRNYHLRSYICGKVCYCGYFIILRAPLDYGDIGLQRLADIQLRYRRIIAPQKYPCSV